MRVIILAWVVLALLLSGGIAFATEKGSVSVIVFKDGSPQSGAEVIVDGERRLRTDADGWAKGRLSPGNHQIEVIPRGGDSSALGYAHKTVLVAPGKDTQITVSLVTGGEAGVAVDTPENATAGAVPVATSDADGGKGTLQLRVRADGSGEPVKGARVFVKGTALEGITDAQGRVELQVPAGAPLSLSVVHADFSAQTLADVQVAVNEAASREVDLTPASMELEEFVVLAPNVEGSIASVIQEQRNTDSVAEVLGAEQFSKQGDSSAASALKRATGLTLVGGRYVFVRGLGDRYSNSRLNEMALPSPNPTQRVVPLDMFPTGVIGSIKVQKTWSAELPANFGGGNIDIRTKDTPDEFFANVSISGTYRDGSTFSDTKSADGGGIDFLGIDDSRGLSSATKDKVDIEHDVQNSDLDVAGDLTKLPSGIQKSSAIPGFKVAGNIGDSVDLRDGKTLGYFASYAYSQDYDSQKLDTRKVSFNGQGEAGVIPEFQKSDIYKHTYSHGGLAGLTLDLNDDHKFRFTNLYINIADDAAAEKNSRNDGDNKSFTTSWFQRDLLISQLEGQHHLASLGDLKVNWSLEAGQANADEPLTKSYSYLKSDEVDYFVLKNSKINYQNNEVHDSLTQWRLDLSYPFSWLSDEESTIALGLSGLSRERDARSRRFALFFDRSGQFQPGELDTAIDSFTLDDFSKINLSSRPTESYTAQHDINALYLSANLKPREYLEIGLGVRSEDSTQDVTSDERGAETNVLVSDSTLPAANITYKLNDSMQLRAGYAETITRPDFREFAKTRFQDPITADIIFGNPFLTYTKLKHFDLRYEWYFNDTDNVTFGVFGKTINNPIETVVFYTDVNPLFTYVNARDADLKGVELSLRKELGFLSGRLQNVTLSGNFAQINSTINIYDDLTGHIDDSLKSVVGELTSKSRPMQGQSPQVLNLQLGYDDKTLDMALLYNVIGRRIVNLGTEGFPDMYEEPFNHLDLVGHYKLADNLKIGMSFKNILDEEVSWKQGDVFVRKYKKGRSIGIKASYRF
ncbi:MAG: TonB-dependent receptor domain-containing protein [bacterium]